MTSSGMQVHQLRSRAANFSAASLQAFASELGWNLLCTGSPIQGWDTLSNVESPHA